MDRGVIERSRSLLPMANAPVVAKWLAALRVEQHEVNDIDRARAPRAKSSHRDLLTEAREAQRVQRVPGLPEDNS
jgi:hypothetical protein